YIAFDFDMARYDAPSGFLMRGIEEEGGSPRIGFSDSLNARKEAEEVMGNEPILVLLGAACVFETKLEGLATIDLPEVRQHGGGPVDKNHTCEPWSQKVLLEIVRWFDVCAVGFVIVDSRRIRSSTYATAGHAAYGE